MSYYHILTYIWLLYKNTPSLMRKHLTLKMHEHMGLLMWIIMYIIWITICIIWIKIYIIWINNGNAFARLTLIQFLKFNLFYRI